jgi:hypothetical protein
LVYEKRLNDFSELALELRALDFDSGIRVPGTHDGKPCFIFITKKEDEFVVAIYSRKRGASGSEIPDQRLVLKVYQEVGLLTKLLEKEASDPLEAYSY